jgi:hypothetical protein
VRQNYVTRRSLAFARRRGGGWAPRHLSAGASRICVAAPAPHGRRLPNRSPARFASLRRAACKGDDDTRGPRVSTWRPGRHLASPSRFRFAGSRTFRLFGALALDSFGATQRGSRLLSVGPAPAARHITSQQFLLSQVPQGDFPSENGEIIDVTETTLATVLTKPSI